jgi:hypothetical protein
MPAAERKSFQIPVCRPSVQKPGRVRHPAEENPTLSCPGWTLSAGIAIGNRSNRSYITSLMDRGTTTPEAFDAVAANLKTVGISRGCLPMVWANSIGIAACRKNISHQFGHWRSSLSQGIASKGSPPYVPVRFLAGVSVL